ncbi:MAG TPA: YdcF family protein [Kofleriaceae bacterium]|nr:YdcF family protein [Kofleriaceae bacterium]
MSWRAVSRFVGRPLAIADREPEPREAIVVLGARLANDSLTPVLVERARVAAELFARGAAPRVIATGGVTSGTRSEADVLAGAIEQLGVPAVLRESRARTTAQNARFVAAMLPRGARVWLVTQPFHARRAEFLFARAGLDARAWHIADSIQYREPARALRWIAREYAAWLKLLVRGV